MLIVAGHLVVDPGRRAVYLAERLGVVEQARTAPGCLDFSLSADVLEPSRINVLERWESVEAVAAFRGSGPDDEQADTVLDASVAEYEVVSTRSLT